VQTIVSVGSSNSTTKLKHIIIPINSFTVNVITVLLPIALVKKLVIEKINMVYGRRSPVHLPNTHFSTGILTNLLPHLGGNYVITPTIINVWPLEPWTIMPMRVGGHLVWEGGIAVCGSIANGLTACQVKTAQHFILTTKLCHRSLHVMPWPLYTYHACLLSTLTL